MMNRIRQLMPALCWMNLRRKAHRQCAAPTISEALSSPDNPSNAEPRDKVIKTTRVTLPY
jgi:hypothetical protein